MCSSVRVARSSSGTPNAANSGGEVADADADHQPPARDLIDARQLLGEQHGLVQRQFQDAGGDGDRGRVRRRQRERDDGVEERDLGSDRVVGRLRAGEHDVLAGPQRIEPAGLGVLRHSHQRVGIGAGPVVDRVEPELHRRTVRSGVMALRRRTALLLTLPILVAACSSGRGAGTTDTLAGIPGVLRPSGRNRGDPDHHPAAAATVRRSRRLPHPRRPTRHSTTAARRPPRRPPRPPNDHRPSRRRRCLRRVRHARRRASRRQAPQRPTPGRQPDEAADRQGRLRRGRTDPDRHSPRQPPARSRGVQHRAGPRRRAAPRRADQGDAHRERQRRGPRPRPRHRRRRGRLRRADERRRRRSRSPATRTP